MNNKSQNNLAVPLAIVLSGILIAAAVLFTGNTSVANVKQAQNAQPQGGGAGAPAQPQGPVRVSIVGEPVLGNPDAPVTIVEFSDYECPFCKRSFDQLLPLLKKNYIDTGKLKLVFRNFPLSFHQNAEKEAEAAECAKDQAGDAAYFKFHDEIFTKTTSNGTGLTLSELPVIAKDIGLNVDTFQTCLNSGKFASEVKKDMDDGSAAGVSGTPSWFIGKSGKESIEGTLIVGAQPYSVFQIAIDQLLKK